MAKYLYHLIGNTVYSKEERLKLEGEAFWKGEKLEGQQRKEQILRCEQKTSLDLERQLEVIRGNKMR